jgi:hypothetical protein
VPKIYKSGDMCSICNNRKLYHKNSLKTGKCDECRAKDKGLDFWSGDTYFCSDCGESYSTKIERDNCDCSQPKSKVYESGDKCINYDKCGRRLSYSTSIKTGKCAKCRAKNKGLNWLKSWTCQKCGESYRTKKECDNCLENDKK